MSKDSNPERLTPTGRKLPTPTLQHLNFREMYSGVPMTQEEINEARAEKLRNARRLMLKYNKDLKPYKKDKFLKLFFRSLWNHNPTYAWDPIIAGGLVRKALQNPDAAAAILMQAHKDAKHG